MLNITESVTYSRKGKTFEATLDETKIGEAYRRREAETLLIEAIAPDVARRVEYVRNRCGRKAGKRAHKGAKLLLADHVHENADGWIVDSETIEGESYAVWFDGGWFCECIDWQNGYAGEKFGAPFVESNGIMCKHCFAVKLSQCRQKKNEQRETQPHAALVRSQSQTTNGSHSSTNRRERETALPVDHRSKSKMWK